MKPSKEYVIQFAGLSEGEHLFEFEINDKFFENLDYSEVKKGKVKVKVNMLKQSTMLVLNFKISGTVGVICDRCADQFDLKIKGKYKLIARIGGKFEDSEDDDIIGISENEHQLDLLQYLYEYIMLSIPIKRIHPDETPCDPEQLKKLKSMLIEEVDKTEEEKKTDPRWDSLKNIKWN